MTQNTRSRAQKRTVLNPSDMSAFAADGSISHAVVKRILELRLAGATLAAVSAETGVCKGTLGRLSGRTHSSNNDLAQLDKRSKLRNCITCSYPLVSQHAGVRMCGECQNGELV